jgi:hypothetical protein
MSEKEMLTCPNEACGKVITNPLKTLNRQQSTKEPYNACPYCLTEITLAEPETEYPSEETATETSLFEEEPSQNQEKIPGCKHYFGYMNEKEHKLQMPEECMLCPQIIDCMDKNNGSTKGKTLEIL